MLLFFMLLKCFHLDIKPHRERGGKEGRGHRESQARGEALRLGHALF
jgi:hypothetical protein